jgi:hypothetical protein
MAGWTHRPARQRHAGRHGQPMAGKPDRHAASRRPTPGIETRWRPSRVDGLPPSFIVTGRPDKATRTGRLAGGYDVLKGRQRVV